jgi:hypothetical protein
MKSCSKALKKAKDEEKNEYEMPKSKAIANYKSSSSYRPAHFKKGEYK